MEFAKISSYANQLSSILDENSESLNNKETSEIVFCSRCNIPGITHGFDIFECEIDNQVEFQLKV